MKRGIIETIADSIMSICVGGFVGCTMLYFFPQSLEIGLAAAVAALVAVAIHTNVK